MSWRVVVVSSRAKLELKMNYMVVRSEDTTRKVHIDEIDALIIENTGCTISVALMEILWEHKVNVVFCDHKYNPGAQLVSLYGSFDNSARIRAQMQWDSFIKDEVWAAIVREKIRKQADCLSFLKKEGQDRVLAYSEGLPSGDPENREGQAAKVYFNALFGFDFFRSDPCFINSALDYGYTILLSAINREIVSNGFLTQIGICHKNIFNHFNLGCDFVEPFRPLVDRVVCKLDRKKLMLDSEDKHALINILNDIVTVRGNKVTVLNAISMYVKSVLDALEDGDLSKICFYEYEL